MFHTAALQQVTDATTAKTSYTPIYIPASTTFDRITMRTASTFSGSAVFRLGIYNNSSDDLPGTVNLDAGTVSPTAASTNYEITISKTLDAGWYWLAINCQTAATTNAIFALTGNSQGGNFALSGSATPNGNTYYGYEQSVSVTSGFATAASIAGNTTPVIVWLRK
jgi:hypothetical protein